MGAQTSGGVNGVQTSERFPVLIEMPSAGCRVVVPHGDVDAHTAPQLRDAIAGQLAADSSIDRLVIDLSRTSFLDSSALGVLIAALKRMREREGRLDVVRPASPIRRIFEITALDQVFALHETRELALASGR